MSAIMSAVYNNYLTAYTPSLTRYDAHKKSELRNVYNSIVKLNKESPWYLPTTSKDTQHYAIHLKENARGLHNTIAQLGGLEENGLLNKKSAFSTDEDIAKATFIGSKVPEGVNPSFSLEVQSLASSQENLGFFLPDAKVGLAPDTYSFDLAVNDMNYEFQFSIAEDETNRDVQDRLMRLINNSDIGIKASIAESDGQTSLRLVSEATGLPNGKTSLFQVTDDRTSKTSGTVAYFGLDYTSKEASNAIFTVNGERREAVSNHFTMSKMFDVQLHGITPEGEPVQIGLKTDIESLTDNVTHLIGGYNEFVKAASTYLETQTKSQKLVREFSGIANRYNSSLEPMGLTMQKDGTLQIDQAQLHRTASQALDIAATFGYLKDFSNALLRKSDQVSLDPMEYVEKKIVAYKNPGHNFISPYSTSAYSGMMFNGYC
ncbi:MAG: flagellar filament capping protein FliD [Acetatifactor sp.]|nr:flagellar filament capping protein FliD [Acetatifactor sp.]